MNAEELAAIEARWSTYGGMGNPRGADDYTDAGCRILAERAFRDFATLTAVLRERDNTIAKVHELIQSWDSGDYDDSHQFSPHHFVRHLRAALDPQETE